MTSTQVKRYSSFTGSIGLPPQAVSTSEKQTPAFREKCMDFFDYNSAQQSREKYDIKRNYDIVNGQLDLREYQYVTDPLSLGQEKNAKYGTTMNVVHYPIMNRPIQTILGEYINRPLNFFVINETDHARNEWIRVKTEMLQSWTQQRIQSRIQMKVQQQGVDPNSEQGQQLTQKMTPEAIQEYMDKDYVDVAEQVSQRMLKTIWRDQTLDDEFTEGFKHAIISAREFYHTYTVNGRVRIRSLSPLDVFYHRSPSVKWISDAQYAGFRLYLTPSSILDLFYDKLKASDIEDLEALVNPDAKRKKDKGATATGINSITYDTSTYSDMLGTLQDRFHNQQLEDMLTNFQVFGNQSNQFSTFGLIKVIQAYWKSFRKVGFLKFYDAQGNEQETIVDDTYTANVSLGEHVTYRYINQVYQGAKIGDDMYIGVQPYIDTILEIDRLDYCPLPIEGCTYNDTNSKPFSLVDLMRPWNEMYNIVAYELRKDMNSSLGKVLFMSVDHIPDIPGFTWDKWYYWARELKIAWVKQPPRGGNTFNQFSAADMSFAQQILAKMETLERVKNECDSMAGFSQPRIGASTQQDTLGQSRQQFIASVNQTEYYFFKHNKLVERVLNYALNLCKKVEKEYGVMRNNFNDMEQAYILNDGDTLSNAKLSLYLTNSAQDLATKQKMEQLLQLAVSNGADVMDCSEILLSQTISEMRNLFASLRRKQANQTEAQRAHEKEMLDKDIKDKQDARNFTSTENDKKLQNNIDVATIKTFTFGKNTVDEDEDNRLDVLEYDEMVSNRDMKQKDQLLKERKQYMDEIFKSRDIAVKAEGLQVKREEMKSKEKVARINPG